MEKLYRELKTGYAIGIATFGNSYRATTNHSKLSDLIEESLQYRDTYFQARVDLREFVKKFGKKFEIAEL